ncbi:hypothetical protein ACLF3G_03065 [Falsiroseomonas sp. HC035]|uniref:hypothetical protein n=1 Tax=Falsiroseomonas sp. HC035 TaxID=3390999 RepID=UPI003D311FBD
MPIAPDSALLARRRDLERDLDRMLELRGPVEEIRRLVTEIDQTERHRSSATKVSGSGK